jgi:superfamily II DNA helicase RecQ
MTQDLILVTAPPASGKTYWMRRFVAEAGPDEVIFISPLRALADECKRFSPPELLVMTPEEWNVKKPERRIVIFDEFHLFFYWGDTFRERMWESFYELSLSARLVVLLTATVSDEMKQEVAGFSSHFDSVTWFDFGNRKLKFIPRKYVKAPHRQWLMKILENEPMGEGGRLVFCRYRDEVFRLEKHLSSIGFRCISCVGGESKFMQLRLQSMPHPDYIISTTVLSHGVNLPLIRKVFFLYETQNIDFWIQMVARGGRKGEEYEVFSLEQPPVSLKWNRFTNLINVIVYSVMRECFPRSWNLLEK